jgi:hypothetical protein
MSAAPFDRYRTTVCKVEGCERKRYCQGFCTMHYRRWLHHGDPLFLVRPLRFESDEERVQWFWRKVNRDGPLPQERPDLGPCWLWTGATNGDGYGRTEWDEGQQPAHRVAYELIVGPIPDGLDLDHLCRVHACVRPEHLDPVTRRENLARGRGAAVTRERHAARRSG